MEGPSFSGYIVLQGKPDFRMVVVTDRIPMANEWL